MTVLEAVFLGIVQGITEVLPISSSAHLVLVPWLWGFSDPGLAFDVALHLGTLIAIVAFFYTDWLKIFKGFFSGIKNKRFKKPEEKLPLFIILATIPGVMAGYFLNNLAENLFRSPVIIAMMLVFFGYIIILAERMNDRFWTSSSSLSSTLRDEPSGSDSNESDELTSESNDQNDPTLLKFRGASAREIKNLNWKNSLITGIAQAIAIIPGVSRSGITISAGMFQGFTREAAARFSFLISAPIILGAGVYEIRKVPASDFQSEIFWAGLISSVIASFLTVKFLMNFVKTHRLNTFAYYRFGLAGIIIFIYLFLR